MTLIVIEITIIIILLTILVRHMGIDFLTETFSTPKDKASTLLAWFTGRDARGITYKKFIGDNPDSNIVEYNKMTKLIHEGGNIDSISEALRVR